MHFMFSYSIDSDDFDTGLVPFVAFLKEQGVETISSLEIRCYPWRNGKRLQAVNSDGVIQSIILNSHGVPERGRLPDAEIFAVRERPDSLGVTGLATLFNHDD